MNKVLECLELMNNGLEYSEVRKILVSEKYDKEQVSQIMREADHLFLNQRPPDAISFLIKAKLKISVGALLFWVSIFISFSSIFYPTWGFYFILGGPIIGGLSLYYSGRKDLRSFEKSSDQL